MSEKNLNADLDAKTQFSALLDALKDSHKESIDTTIKIAAALSVVVGWTVVQKNPFTILCESRALTYFSLVAVVLGLLCIAYLYKVLRDRWVDSYTSMIALGFDERLFRRYKVSDALLSYALFCQVTLLVGIFFLILYKYALTSTVCL